MSNSPNYISIGTSGGYARPSFNARSETRSTFTPSAGDRAVSRRTSGSTLDQFRAAERQATPVERQVAPVERRAAPSEWQATPVERQAAPVERQAAPSERQAAPSGRQPAPASSWRPNLGSAPSRETTGYGRGQGRPSFETTYRPTSTEGWGWRPPDYVRPTQSTYNGWNPFLFWFLLDQLDRSDSVNFFHDREYDAGYRQWRALAERQARSDAELRAKLDALDARLAAKEGDPRNPDYLPSGVSAASAHAAAVPVDAPAVPINSAAVPIDAPASGGLRWRFLLVVLLLGCAVVIIVYAGRQNAVTTAVQPTGGPLDGLKTATNIVRQKMPGTPLTLKPFRVGMALTLDPTPFILAQGATKVPTPKAEGQTAFANVQAIGTIEGAPLHRLHLDENTFIQIHLDGNRPDECRYLAQIDEVEPADAEEWKLWLEPDQGMIGWPQFQAKDGKLYDRVWSPGAQWIAPVPYVESLEGKSASPSVKGVMMLYGAPTGLAEPAPQTEYILVASAETASEGAWVAIHAGIDVNPAALSLT